MRLFPKQPGACIADVVTHVAALLQLVGNPSDREISFKAYFTAALPVVAQPEQDFWHDEVVRLLPVLVEVEDIRDEARVVVEEPVLGAHQIRRMRYSGIAMPRAPIAVEVIASSPR